MGKPDDARLLRSGPSAGSGDSVRFPAWAVVTALVVKSLLALSATGTNDALTWEHDLSTLRTKGPAILYRNGVQYTSPAGKLYQRQLFIHPPAMVSILYGLGTLQDLSGLSITFWMRLLCAFADAGTVFVVWLMVRRTATKGLMVLLALSPISILVSGFHANTDPAMIFFVVMSVFLAERRQSSYAAVAFGLAMSIKLVPIIYLPAMIVSLPRNTVRARCAVIAAATWIALSMPVLARYPSLILKTILNYGGATGLWGFYFLSGLLETMGVAGPYNWYAPAAKWCALVAVLLLPFVFRRLAPRSSLFVQCGSITFLFLFLSPGFGLQYLAWTVPWIVSLGIGPAAGYYAIAGTFMIAVYAEAGGLKAPGYADLLTVTNWTMLMLMGLVCWAAIGTVAWRYVQVALGRRKDGE